MVAAVTAWAVTLVTATSNSNRCKGYPCGSETVYSQSTGCPPPSQTSLKGSSHCHLGYQSQCLCAPSVTVTKADSSGTASAGTSSSINSSSTVVVAVTLVAVAATAGSIGTAIVALYQLCCSAGTDQVDERKVCRIRVRNDEKEYDRHPGLPNSNELLFRQSLSLWWFTRDPSFSGSRPENKVRRLLVIIVTRL